MSEFRRWMILTEAYADSITIGSKAWDIFRNPSRKEYREALADHAMVRAFLVGDDIFVWNVFGAVHRSVRDFMKLPHETIIPLVIFGKPGQRCVAEVTDHVQNTMWAHNGAVAAAIQNHPYMRRMFTKVTVQYYDEDIVGDWQKLDPKLNEGLHDDEPADHGSYGWWIFPDGKVAEMEEAGAHGWIADQWLTSQMSIPEAPYEEAIETLVAHGGVRVATFHGSDAMGIDFPPTLVPVVRRALLKLVSETRGAFHDYYSGYDTVHRFDYLGILKVIRDHKGFRSPGVMTP